MASEWGWVFQIEIGIKNGIGIEETPEASEFFVVRRPLVYLLPCSLECWPDNGSNRETDNECRRESGEGRGGE